MDSDGDAGITDLDEFNGHLDENGIYHYHSKDGTRPYVTGGIAGVVTGNYETNGYVVDNGGTTKSPRNDSLGCFLDTPFTDEGLLYNSSGNWHSLSTQTALSSSDTGSYDVQKVVYQHYEEDDYLALIFVIMQPVQPIAAFQHVMK